MIQNVIFDLGRVLINYEPEEYLKALGYDSNTVGELMRLVFRNPLWAELDRGTYDNDMAKKAFKNQSPTHSEAIDRIFSNVSMLFTLKEDTEEFFKSLKQEGYKLYILSNFAKEGFDYVRNTFGFFDLTDGMVISSHVGLIKPEPEIYKHILDKYGLTAAETVFIDDLKVNTDAAAALGINTIIFDNLDNVINKFRNLVSQMQSEQPGVIK